MKRRIAPFILGVLGPILAWCGSADAGPMQCGLPYFAVPGAATATIVGPDSQRTHFVDHDGRCEPDGCRRQAYLVPGDQVVIAMPGNGWACALFRGSKRDSFGWLRLNQLSVRAADPSPPLTAWVGRWSVADRQLDVMQGDRPGSLLLTGQAEYPWQGSTQPLGNVARYADQYCGIRLELLGDWLVVNDDAPCGSRRASFTGIYRRAPPLAPPSAAH